MAGKDELFAQGERGRGVFAFDERVAEVFSDMIERSVPGYDLVVNLTAMMANRFAQEHSRLYDLGCSLAAVTLAMRHAVAAPGARIVAVDASAAMVRRCREIVEADGGPLPVDVVQADLRFVPIENASVVVMNYTLQFVDPADRLDVLRRVAAGLKPGGVLILSEKMTLEDAASQARQTGLHHEFKRAKGYSEIEISAKRNALENVLISDTPGEHETRLRRAGFSTVDCWFRCFTFAGFLAIR